MTQKHPERNGDLNKWFDSLVTEFYPGLVDFARIITRNRESSEEIVNDVLIKVWDRREEVVHIEKLPSYLYKAVRNASLNYLSKKGRTADFSFEQVSEFNLPVYDSTPESELITREMMGDFMKAVNELPAQCKLIFKLAREEGLKYREIAELLHLSEKTVEHQISIAIKKIAEVIQSEPYKQLTSKNLFRRLFFFMF
jgi:RNA polymerase sigma-70 factor (family 1)